MGGLGDSVSAVSSSRIGWGAGFGKPRDSPRIVLLDLESDFVELFSSSSSVPDLVGPGEDMVTTLGGVGTEEGVTIVGLVEVGGFSNSYRKSSKVSGTF